MERETRLFTGRTRQYIFTSSASAYHKPAADYRITEGSLIGDKAVSVVFDNSKLKRAVPDMRTTVRFDQGVRIALEYILAHPQECQKEMPLIMPYRSDKGQRKGNCVNPGEFNVI